MSDYKRGDKPKGRDYTYILQWMEYAETLEAKCARLEAELAISKGREEGKQLVINQLEGENAQLRKNDDEYFAKCKILTINNINLHAECERLRQGIETIRRMVCGIGIVGAIDSHDVIRRSSVIDIIDAQLKEQP